LILFHINFIILQPKFGGHYLLDCQNKKQHLEVDEPIRIDRFNNGPKKGAGMLLLDFGRL
jgi:hypothetical protein